MVEDMPSPGEVDPGPDGAHGEVARLRAENARLRDSMQTSHPGRRRGWWRPVVAGLLVAVAAVLAPLSVLATWASGQISDTDRYLETVAPLANEPAVQAAIATRVEDVVFSYLDLESVTEELVAAITAQGIPAPAAVTLRAVAGPLAGAIRGFVADRIDALVRSDVFEDAWIEANRTAHSSLVAALTGESGSTVAIDQGAVQVNLAALINTVKEQLIDAGFAIADRIPEVAATFTIVESENLANVRSLLGILDGLATWLPVLGLGLLGVAIVIARDRRRVVLAAGLAVAGSMLLLGAALNALRPFYLDALPASSSVEAAGVVYDQLVSFIRLALRGVLVVALTVAVVAWLSAPSGAGAAARRGLVRGIDTLRGGTARAGLRTGRLGVALDQNRGPIRVAVLGVAAVAYLAQDHPTGGTALMFVICIVVALLVLELLATPSPGEDEPRPYADGDAGAAPGSPASSRVGDPTATAKD
jgi:hypothetical protein